ncbi:type III restriction endonuclease subunit R [Leptolyngbya valderiana BDU 20041]|nr:type III restriction endonuclease subunit R [Leptolyngbya valderiana BDU 20041]
MKFTLKDYQDEAVRDVLERLSKARKRWREDGERHAFSLTAPTGSGKTVMAAAAFEALFHGDDGFDFDRDPGAVVIWFSDDPALNEQTQSRLIESSDRLLYSHLKIVPNHFNQAKFDAGRIYFLNTQKLGKNSLLVRGFEGNDADEFLPEMRPDRRSHTIWDTIRNTIEDPNLTLYLVLDEAHRGLGKEIGERATIVRRLINGHKGVPGIPVVWGISATVERFNTAMDGARGRITLPHVTVDTARVQESGLLKDTIALDIPDEDAGSFDTVLVRRAADKLRESTREWAAYTEQQEAGESVVPLMVLQVPNKPSHNEIGRWLDAIFEQWPQLPETSIANVLGEHKTETFGQYTVPYIAPQRVQDDPSVRVLIAKDAISTGWDCPRAEVMISFRPANDETNIAQLLGRMVRTPLARRIPGNDKLNSVDCILPKFDRETVHRVIEALRTGADATLTGRILINPVELMPNPDVPDSVWQKFVSLPSQTRPQRGAKPPVRLTILAHELASDGLLPGAGGKAHAAMHKVLDDLIAGREQEFAEKRASVMTVDGRTFIADLRSGQTTDQRFHADADDAVVDDAFRRTARIISPDIARTYTKARAERKPAWEDDPDEALIEAREDVAALHLLENLQVLFYKKAKAMSDAWLAEYRPRIGSLPDDRQEEYRRIIALSTEPQDVELVLPLFRSEPTRVQEADGTESEIPTYPQHLLCDEQGQYPCELKHSWERKVLAAEMDRDGFRFWYRNPDRPSQDSLGIACDDDGETKITRPDFVFFAEQDGEIVADIVDPHGTHLADAIPKLKGLARYAENHLHVYRRIEGIAEANGKMRVLDMTRDDVREAVMAARNAEQLYKSEVANDYA